MIISSLFLNDTSTCNSADDHDSAIKFNQQKENEKLCNQRERERRGLKFGRGFSLCYTDNEVIDAELLDLANFSFATYLRFRPRFAGCRGGVRVLIRGMDYFLSPFLDLLDKEIDGFVFVLRTMWRWLVNTVLKNV
ncbi:hypothetical protein CEXT_587721 [Caerostris extrusa]|uniref:Uncharacterized protein n=1 Tax=Caerostris extrusa TaxID=172846 RepID=A0AAV4VXR0_CAEEX|nr:hypothetical protein CEXT_587721 [Caerostris extrusa]